MAITRNSLLTSTAVGAPGASTTTSSVTNTAGALLLLAICTGDTGGAPADPTGVTGLGLTWVKVNSTSVGNLAQSVWRAMGASSTGTLTITWTGGGVTDSAIYQLDEFVGVTQGGTNGSGAIAQSGTSNANTATPSVTLGATPLATSVVYAAVNHNDTAQTASAGTNMTALLGAGTTTQGSPSQHQAVGWNTTASPSATLAFSWSGAGNAPMVALEIISDRISFRSATTAFDDAAPTSKVISVPAGVIDGDMLIMAVAVRNASGSTTINTPSGWTKTLGGAGTTGTSFIRHDIFWRVAASEPANYTPTWSQAADCAITILAYRNVDGVDPLLQDFNVGQSLNTSPSTSATMSSGGHVQLYADTMWLWSMAICTSSTGDPTFVPTSGGTTRANVFGASDVQLLVDEEYRAASLGAWSTSRVISWTPNSNGFAGAALQLRPSAPNIAQQANLDKAFSQSIPSSANVPAPSLPQIITPSSIITAESVPSPQLNLSVFPSSIVTAANVPTPALSYSQFIQFRPTPVNVLTYNQATLEDFVTTGWSGNACTIATTSVQKLAGNASLQMTATSTTSFEAVTTTYATVPGDVWSARASFRSAVTGRAVLVQIRWGDAGNALLGSATGGNTDTTSGWVECTVDSAVAPAGSAFVSIKTTINATVANGEVHYVDQVTLQRGALQPWDSPIPLDYAIPSAESFGNILTLDQASSENVLWYVANAGAPTVSRVTGEVPAFHGDYVIKMVSTGAGNMDLAWGGSNASRVPVTPGQTYTVCAAFRAATVGRSVNVQVHMSNAAGAYQGSLGGGGTTGTDATGSWLQCSSVITIPLGTDVAFIAPNIIIQSVAGAGEIHYADAVGVFKGSRAAAAWELPEPQVNQFIAASSIVTAESVPSASVVFSIGPSSIVTAESVPSFTIIGGAFPQSITAVSITAPFHQFGGSLLTLQQSNVQSGSSYGGNQTIAFRSTLAARTGTGMLQLQVPRTQNMLTANQASLETDTTGWSATGNSTIARSTAQFLDGAASLAITSIASGTMFAQTTAGTAGHPCFPDTQYTARADVRAAASARTCSITMRFYDAAGSQLTDVAGTGVADATGSWTSITSTGNSPPTAAYVAVFISVSSTGAGGEVHYVDKIQIVHGSSTTWGGGGNCRECHTINSAGYSNLACAPSTQYTLGLWGWQLGSAAGSQSQTRLMRVQVLFYDSGGTFISAGTGPTPQATLSTTAWTQSTGTITSPANAAYGIIQVMIQSTVNMLPGELFYLDDVTFEPVNKPIGFPTALTFTGVSGSSRWAIPWTAENTVTGDIEVVVYAMARDWSPGQEQILAAQYKSTTNERNWILYQSAGSNILWGTSTNGTGITQQLTFNPGWTDGTWHWLRVIHDVDNGNGQNVMTAYTRTLETDPWTQIATVTNTGVVTRFAPTTAQIYIGNYEGGSSNWGGDIAYVEIKDRFDGQGRTLARFDTRVFARRWSGDGSAISPTSPNYLPGMNLLAASPSFEDVDGGIAGWGANQCTLKRVPVNAVGGVWSMRATATVAAANVGPFVNTSNRTPVTPGRTYTLSFWATKGLGNHSMAARLEWQNASFVTQSNASGTAAALTTTPQLYTLTAVCPAGCVWAAVTPYATTTAAIGDFFDIDAVSFFEAGDAWKPTGTAWNWHLALTDEQLNFEPDGQFVHLSAAPSSYFSTPDNANIRITGDIDIRIGFRTTASGVTGSLLGKWQNLSREYRLDLGGGGQPQLYNNPDGTSGTELSTTGTAFPSYNDGQLKHLRITLDVDNGAGGNTLTYYRSVDGINWIILSRHVRAGTTSLFSGTSPLYLGSIGGGTGTQNFPGEIAYVEVHRGINGDVVAAFDADMVTITGVVNPNTVPTQNGAAVWTASGNWQWSSSDALGVDPHWTSYIGAPDVRRSTISSPTNDGFVVATVVREINVTYGEVAVASSGASTILAGDRYCCIESKRVPVPVASRAFYGGKINWNGSSGYLGQSNTPSTINANGGSTSRWIAVGVEGLATAGADRFTQQIYMDGDVLAGEVYFAGRFAVFHGTMPDSWEGGSGTAAGAAAAGPSSINQAMTASSIATAANVSSPMVSQQIYPTSIVTAANVPSPQINLKIFPNAITSRENVPQPKSVGPPITLSAWELRVYRATDGSLVGYVPRWRALTFRKAINEIGNGAVELDLDDPIFLAIGDSDLLEHENVWVVFWNGNRVFAFHNQEVAENLVQANGLRTVTMSGDGIGKRLKYGAILPQGFPSWAGNGRIRKWPTSGSGTEQPMKAWRDLFLEAQARGAISGITTTFSNAVDSKSVPWPASSATHVELEVGSDDISTLLSKYAELSNADWIVNPDGTLDVAVQVVDGGGNYLSGLGDRLENLVRFQVAHDQISFSRNRHRSEIHNVLYVEAANGDIGYPAPTDSGSTTTWGRRETYLKAPDASDATAALVFGSKAIPTMRGEQAEVNITVIPDHVDRVVFFDYDVGDWIGVTANDSRLYGVNNGAYRVMAISISVDDSAMSTVQLTCQTVLDYKLARLQKAIASGGGAASLNGGGSSVSGSGGAAQDVVTATMQATVPPPTTLNFAGGANANDIYVDVSWVAGAQPVNSSDPVLEYEVQVTPAADATQRRVIRTRDTKVRVTGLVPDAAYVVLVQGITRLGRSSLYLGGAGTGGDYTSGHDTTIPTALPGSNGNLTMGAGLRSVVITWNNSTDPDVANGNGAYEVELDTNASFNNLGPPAGKYRIVREGGSISGFGDLLPNTTYYTRVRPIDSSGNAGPYTTAVSATTQQTNATDVGTDSVYFAAIQNDAVDTAKIKDAAILNAKIKDLEVTNAKIFDVSATKITTGTLTATISISTGGIIQADYNAGGGGHNYFVADGNGIRFVKGASNAYGVGGTPGVEQIRLDNVTGSITLAGSITSSAIITGGEINGGTIRAGTTNGTANPRIILDATSLRALNSGGTAVTTIDVTGANAGRITTSNIVATGGTIGGLTITGALSMDTGGIFRTNTTGTGKRIEITTSTFNRIDFYTGNAFETASGHIITDSVSGQASIQITGPDVGSGTGLLFIGGSHGSGPLVQLQADGNRGFLANGSATYVYSDTTIFLNGNTSASGSISCNGITDFTGITTPSVSSAFYALSFGAGGAQFQDRLGVAVNANAGLDSECITMGGGNCGLSMHQRSRSANDTTNRAVVYAGTNGANGGEGMFLWSTQDLLHLANGQNVHFPAGLPALGGGVNAQIVVASWQMGVPTSSGRYKEDVVDLPESGEANPLWALRPVRFRWRDGGVRNAIEANAARPNGTPGLIAEEVAAVAPEAVVSLDSETPSLDDRILLTYAIEAIQHLRREIDELKTKRGNQ